MARQGTSLRTYVLTRIALSIPTVLILLTMVFLLMRVAPGNPIQAALGGHVSEKQIQARSKRAGYDKPIVTQYVNYLGDAVTGHLGNSLTDHRSIGSILVENGSATLELSIAAFAVALVVGLSIGILAGRFRDSPIDLGGRLFGIFIYAAPVFFTGFLAQLFFSHTLGWLPSSGRVSPLTEFDLSQGAQPTHFYLIDSLVTGNFSAFWDAVQHLILPAVTLGLLISGVLIRLVRVNLMQTMKGDYVEAARARGISERRVVIKHAFRNALVPVVTVAGLQFATLLGGAILTEETFNWPGIGSELVRYLNERDYIAVQGIVTVFAIAVVVVSLLIDLVNAFVDPRVRY
ncbi:MAG: peptide/nickel transport system permease protein [Solirubrobacterales bacterium]|jgi:peptide/nickel transport system permease protein|nr:peptide/nickel transport system permease protein [Solirubrobacterales bacterium]